MRLIDIPFGEIFWWKGRKWVQVIRPKHPKSKSFKITCAQHPQGEWLSMPSGRVVKKVIRVGK